MRFQILHESPGRARLKAVQYSMTMEQADLLEAWVLALPGVDQVIVHERLGNLTVLFHGDRKELYIRLSRFSYEKAAKDFNANYNNYKYDLIYSDDDNTPELVIDTGKKVTIYTITNNKARLIVRNQNTAKWKYGTSSFCYVPKKSFIL